MARKTEGSKRSMRTLARRRLDETGRWIRESGGRIRVVPQAGWVAAIRDALGMSVQDFADRLGITRASAAKLEANERRRTIQLDTLHKAADALGCDLVYALVPRVALEQTVQARRLEIARSLESKATIYHTALAIPDRLLWRHED